MPGRVGPIMLIGPTVDPERRAARHQLLGGLRDAAREPLGLLSLAAATKPLSASVRSS